VWLISQFPAPLVGAGDVTSVTWSL
jgi:hypothetical protein